MSPTSRRLLALFFLTPIGFGTKFYAGPGSDWVHAYAGALGYEIFWVLLARLCFPRTPLLRVAVGVFLATSVIECSQLSQHPWLEAIRSSLIGSTLIGTTFDPSDFLYYALGSAMGVWLDSRIVRLCQEPLSPRPPAME